MSDVEEMPRMKFASVHHISVKYRLNLQFVCLLISISSYANSGPDITDANFGQSFQMYRMHFNGGIQYLHSFNSEFKKTVWGGLCQTHDFILDIYMNIWTYYWFIVSKQGKYWRGHAPHLSCNAQMN